MIVASWQPGVIGSDMIRVTTSNGRISSSSFLRSRKTMAEALPWSLLRTDHSIHNLDHEGPRLRKMEMAPRGFSWVDVTHWPESDTVARSLWHAWRVAKPSHSEFDESALVSNSPREALGLIGSGAIQVRGLRLNVSSGVWCVTCKRR